MKKFYAEPQIELRKYKLNSGSVTTSDPSANGKNDLNKDDQIDFFK